VIHTFREVVEDHIATHSDGWRNPKHIAQWTSTLAAHAYPVIGDTPVDEIDVAVVLNVLRPIWTKTPETASRLRGRIEAILDAAKGRGWRNGENPARWKGMLKGMLPARAKVARVQHQPSLPWGQLPAFLSQLRTEKGTASRALEFAILTASRTGEVRGMRWHEVDLAGGVWVVPADRMKAGRLHRVPLSPEAVVVLAGMMPAKTKPDGFVFESAKRGVPLSDMALSMVVRRMNGRDAGVIWKDVSGRAAVPHGFRSTFRVWAGETTSYPREVVEAALAHALRDKVEAAYARTDLMERRRPLMAGWGAWCKGESSPGTDS
jgi:integrase